MTTTSLTTTPTMPSLQSPLLTLPAEIRMSIYTHLLPTPGTIRIKGLSNTKAIYNVSSVAQAIATTSWTYYPFLPLLLTCRQIYSEAASSFTSRTTHLKFIQDAECFDFLSHMIPSQFLENIRLFIWTAYRPKLPIHLLSYLPALEAIVLDLGSAIESCLEVSERMNSNEGDSTLMRCITRRMTGELVSDLGQLRESRPGLRINGRRVLKPRDMVRFQVHDTTTCGCGLDLERDRLFVTIDLPTSTIIEKKIISAVVRTVFVTTSFSRSITCKEQFDFRD